MKIKNRIIIIYLLTALILSPICISNFTVASGAEAVKTSDSYKLTTIIGNLLNKFFSRHKDDEQIPKKAELLFVGDLMVGRYVGTLIKRNKTGVHHLLKNLLKKDKDFFNGYDVISANLEGAVTDKGSHYNPKYTHDFAFLPDRIEVFKDYNFNFFNLANNHFGDQGVKGVKETRKHLDSMGIDYSGCRDGDIGGCTYNIINAGTFSMAMVGFSMVYKTPKEEEMIKIIEKAKKESDKLIVNVHWGIEYGHKFNKKQQNLAYKFIDAGADLIIGHHPHVVQGMEFYKGKAIFYSLGNFIFDQYFSRSVQEGLTINASFEGDDIKYSFHPIKSKKSQVYLMNDAEKKIFMKKFIGWSKLEEDEKALIGF